MTVSPGTSASSKAEAALGGSDSDVLRSDPEWEAVAAPVAAIRNGHWRWNPKSAGALIALAFSRRFRGRPTERSVRT